MRRPLRGLVVLRMDVPGASAPGYDSLARYAGSRHTLSSRASVR
jgi:hypothetical protein